MSTRTYRRHIVPAVIITIAAGLVCAGCTSSTPSSTSNSQPATLSPTVPSSPHPSTTSPEPQASVIPIPSESNLLTDGSPSVDPNLVAEASAAAQEARTQINERERQIRAAAAAEAKAQAEREAAAAAEAKRQQPKSVYIVGDSLTVGAQPYLEENLPSDNTTLLGIDAVGGRSAGNGIDALLSSSQAQNANTWVLALGTNDNDDPNTIGEDVQRVMNAAGKRNVYWVNVVRPGYFRINAKLVNLASIYKNLEIIDWAALTNAHPEYLAGGDGVHANDEGYQARSNMIIQALRG